MQPSSIATRDPRDGRPIEIAGRSVQWSSGTRWDGVVGERIQVERAAPPEFETADHCVVLPLTAGAVEFHEGGRFRRYELGRRAGRGAALHRGSARRVLAFLDSL